MDSITKDFAASDLSKIKFKIQQSIPSDSIKKGPRAIVRAAELNNVIEIQRRFGEGDKPLFDRDEIEVNNPIIPKLHNTCTGRDSNSPERYRLLDNKKHSSPPSSRRKSPKRSARHEGSNQNRNNYAHNSKYTDNQTDRYKKREKSKSRSPPSQKKKSGEKLPYYRDEQREKDRLRRLYGRSRSRSPPTCFSRKYSHETNRHAETPSRRRLSSSRERHRRYSPTHRSFKRDYRSRKSRSRSRTRSPQRHERQKHSSRSSRERDKDQKEDNNSLAAAFLSPTPQFIPIPVAVPADYSAYSFPGWTAPPTTWHPSHHRPPRPRFASFPMLPMMPPIRPYESVPPTIHYTPMSAPFYPHALQRFPPPRHSTNYQLRPKKPSS